MTVKNILFASQNLQYTLEDYDYDTDFEFHKVKVEIDISPKR